MAVRKTESRLPTNHDAGDLGQFSASGGNRCTLVSFIQSPLVENRENQYILFVTDATLASSAQSYEWRFIENGTAPSVLNTAVGQMTYRPMAVGQLEVAVRILGSGGSELDAVALTQSVVPANAELEALLDGGSGQPGPTAGNPDAARELVNDHNIYYQSAALQSPESGDGFKRFVFNMAYEGAIQRNMAERQTLLAEMAEAINSSTGDFAALAARGFGLCGIRLVVLAMSQTPPLLPWTELPEAPSTRALADENLRRQLAGLNEQARIDLFNLVRFPKSNITWTGKIIENLRNRYFAGANFNDVLTGMSGTRAHWITRHFREGPIQHS